MEKNYIQVASIKQYPIGEMRGGRERYTHRIDHLWINPNFVEVVGPPKDSLRKVRMNSGFSFLIEDNPENLTKLGFK